MLITILVFFLVLSILVFVHEFGHFLMAKKIGVRVEEFGFGLPPRIWGKQIGETLYSINWLPIGGFVKLSGEETEDESQKLEIKSQKEMKRYFFMRSKKERAAILLAGVVMNFLLAIVIISFIFTQGVMVPSDHVNIDKVIENSPASAAGFKEKDQIISFNNTRVETTDELIKITADNAGKAIPVIVNRAGKEISLVITPRRDPPKDQGPMGIVISNLEEKKYSVWQAPFYGTSEALKLSETMLISLGNMLWRLITFQKANVDVAGPIGIAQATGQAVKYGYLAVLQLMGILSLNLAIVNVLPIPALDGGRLLFVFVEKFMGRKVKPKAERIAHQIGMAFLLSLIVLVTINDIVRLIRG